ncbi:MAG: hypothetical protein AAF456_22220 [Planctomycetota bacterium]
MLKTVVHQGICILAAGAFACVLPGFTSMELCAQDAVYLVEGQPRSRLQGTITSVDRNKIVLDSNAGPQEIAASIIRKVEFEDEPREIDRARDQLADGQYNNCLAELAKITDAPANPLAQQEINFLRAYATALNALSGGGIAANDAGSAMHSFLTGNQNSFHYYPCKEALGRLFLAVGMLDQAKANFNELTQSDWNEYILSGSFYLGRIAMIEQDAATARSSFDAMINNAGQDEDGRSMKLVGRCMLAAIDAMNGDAAGAETTIHDIIRNENPSDQRLFAAAYNALGMAYESAGDVRKASRAYLHTELLFPADEELHAEALFRLSRIWPDLGEPDRANRARSTLLDRYPNSYWTSQL